MGGLSGDRPRTVSLADDDRARIPFAVVAVLLLVSSVMVVATLQTRPEPQIDRQGEDALERGEAVAIGELRHAVTRASERVARAPVTTVDGEVDTVLEDGDDPFERQLELAILAEASDSLDGRQLDVGRETTVEVSLPAVDDWEDEDDLAAALDSVHLEADDGVLTATIEDVGITVLEDGEPVRESTQNVTVSVGTTVLELHERTEAYEEYLNTGGLDALIDRDGYGFDLGWRLWGLTWGKAYYDRIRGDPGDRAFDNVSPNDHTEVLANDARLSAQQEIFGTQDDYGNRVLLGPMLCLAYDVSEAALDLPYDFDGYAEDLHPDENVTSVQDLCTEGIVSPDGELPDVPTVEEIVGDVLEGLLGEVEMEGEIQGHAFADLAMQEMKGGLDRSHLREDMYTKLNESNRFSEKYLEDYYGEGKNERLDTDNLDTDVDDALDILGGFEEIGTEAIAYNDLERVISDTYAVETSFGAGHLSEYGRSAHPSPPALDHEEYDTANHTVVNTEWDTSRTITEANIERVGGDTDSSLDRTLVAVEVEMEMEYTTTREWNDTTTEMSPDVVKSDRNSATFTGSYELDGRFAPDVSVDPDDIEHVLEPGGAPGPGVTATNWEGATDEVITAFFGESIEDDEALESWLETRDDSIFSESDFEDAIGFDRGYQEDVRIDPSDESWLHTWIMNDLLAIHLETVLEIDPVEAHLMDVLDPSPESPIRSVEGNAEAIEPRYVNATGDFENAPDLARMEARQTYFDNIYGNVDAVAGEHEKLAQGADNMMDDLFGGALDRLNALLGAPMEMLDQLLGDAEAFLQDDEGTTLETPEVMNDVYVDVDGSPTYHTSQVAVERSEVPAVRAESAGPLDVDEDVEFGPMAAGYDNQFGYPGFPLIPWPPMFYVQLDGWQIKVEGEYARFEVGSTSGDPSAADTTTYVREAKDVSLETPDGGEITLGSTDPISYENSVSVAVFVPAPQFLSTGAPGVGNNRAVDTPMEECSPFWDNIGPGISEDHHQPAEECVS